MRILGIETSCDETSVGIVEYDSKNQTVIELANIVSSSLEFHAKTGGIIPEIAAREQIKYMLPVLKNALKKGINFDLDHETNPPEKIDAIAVTYGPGLIGSLLVGVETARTLSFLWNKPLIPVNHMIGHVYANFISRNSKLKKQTDFPALALVVSGGHTDLLLIKNHGSIQLLGGTRDDAAGEAFDKIGRLLGLPYPAGPTIESLAKEGDPNRFRFPRPMIGSKDFDFSFSGLKTAVYREVQTMKQLNNQTIADICYAVQDAIVDVIVKKTLKAAKKHDAKSILLSGGVAANEHLYQEFIHSTKYLIHDTEIFVPQKSLCTDNGAMIAAGAAFNFKPVEWSKVIANPELYY